MPSKPTYCGQIEVSRALAARLKSPAPVHKKRRSSSTQTSRVEKRRFLDGLERDGLLGPSTSTAASRSRGATWPVEPGSPEEPRRTRVSFSGRTSGENGEKFASTRERETEEQENFAADLFWLKRQLAAQCNVKHMKQVRERQEWEKDRIREEKESQEEEEKNKREKREKTMDAFFLFLAWYLMF